MLSDLQRPAPGAPSALRQLGLLLRLWWRHVRRRSIRLGEAPRRSGVPTFLLINLLSLFYLVPLVWRAVKTSMRSDSAFFAWHMLGVLLIALGAGLSKGAGSLQVRGMRSDAFLEALPLTTPARLGLQLADGAFVLPFSCVVPIAGAAARGAAFGAALLPALLGFLAYVAIFVVGQALVAWGRALGPPATGRRSLYAGVGLNLAGLGATLVPFGQLLESGGSAAALLTQAWLAGEAGLYALFAGAALLLWAAYRLLVAAERAGFDQLVMAGSAPPPRKGVQDRLALEWQLLLRQGGRASLIMLGALVLAALAAQVAYGAHRVPTAALFFVGGFAVYLGAILTIAQAGRAARSDLAARPFLAALPLSPHQVLDGKAFALRRLLLPIYAVLTVVAGIGTWQGEPSLIYRMALALLTLYIAVDAAISVAFLAHGVGVVGVGGGQGSSSFSTQLLMLPLLATVLAVDNWAATVSAIAVAAVTWEARRAARLSVRWLDDSGDDLERETTVWRALLATTAFFTLQAMSILVLDLFDTPPGYMLAIAFGSSAALLALLTYRNGRRFERPRFLPQRLWAWPAGALAGAGSGWLALRMAELLPAQIDAETQSFSTGEAIAIFVTLVVMAPLAEEYFFRGWLQKAIENDLPAEKKRWAFALGALAFALAHVGSYGVPQLVLGLCAGALYAAGGGLWPAILAHAIHNGLVLLTHGQ